jgi:hypothetical protein
MSSNRQVVITAAQIGKGIVASEPIQKALVLSCVALAQNRKMVATSKGGVVRGVQAVTIENCQFAVTTFAKSVARENGKTIKGNDGATVCAVKSFFVAPDDRLYLLQVEECNDLLFPEQKGNFFARISRCAVYKLDGKGKKVFVADKATGEFKPVVVKAGETKYLGLFNAKGKYVAPMPERETVAAAPDVEL